MIGRLVAVALLVAPGGICSPEGDLKSLLAALGSDIRPGEAMEHVRDLYATDHWFTFPKFMETAQYLKRTLETMGLKDVEVVNAPADGVSQVGYWTMPMAWDVKRGRLEIEDSQAVGEFRILADYEKLPTSLGMWSGATPAGGIGADLVELRSEQPAEIEKLDLRGKLVLTRQNPSGIKWALARSGALGAVNTFSENPDLRDGRQWINSWGDNGWAFLAGGSRLLCFSISPRQTAYVRQLLAKKGSVRVKATVESRYYRGSYPYVTGVIPGTGSGEEVLLLGHTSEQGAGDNATGVSAILEAAGSLNRLITAGTLARPRRSVRVLAMGEMYGTLHYLVNHRERVNRTVAAMNIDTPAAAYELPGTEYTFYLNPDVAKSYVDAFVLRVAREYFASVSRPWHWHAYASADTFMGEPMIGIPTVWPYSGKSGIETHHNSEDTPKRVDERSLRDLSTVAAAYAYTLAAAGEARARWLAELASERGIERVKAAEDSFEDRMAAAAGDALAGLLQKGLEMAAYTVDRERQSVESAARLAPDARVGEYADRVERAGAEAAKRLRRATDRRAAALGRSTPVAPAAVADPQIEAAGDMIVQRLRIGSLPLDEIPPDEREGFPSSAWDRVPQLALFWCDGNRRLGEVIRLVKLETGPTDFDYVGYFRFLAKHGYVRLSRRSKIAP